MAIVDVVTLRLADLKAERLSRVTEHDTELAKLDAAIALLTTADAALTAQPELGDLFDRLAAMNILPTVSSRGR